MSRPPAYRRIWRVVELGTGSVGGALLTNGRKLSVGGWGFPSGDEGSGAWLGLRAAQLAQQALDGRPLAGVPVALSFNLWFSPGGLLAPSATPRVYGQAVQHLRQAGHAAIDSLIATPAELAHRCDF